MRSTNDDLSFSQAKTGTYVPSGVKDIQRQVHCGNRFKKQGHFSYECTALLHIPVTSDKPDTPMNAIETGNNHLNIGKLTLNDVASDDSNEDSGLEFSFNKKDEKIECTLSAWSY